MPDLTGADERRSSILLALLVAAILLLPLTPSAAQISRPGPVEGAEQQEPLPVEEVVAEEEPPAEPAAEEGAPAEEAPAEEEAAAEEPAPAEAQGQPEVIAPPVPVDPAPEREQAAEASEEPAQPTAVEAEGTQAQEVVAAPEAPEPARDEAAADPAAAEAAGEPVDVTATYGVNVTPSLGTAARPLTNAYQQPDAPLVLAPMVAGPDGKPVELDGATLADKAALLGASDPLRNAAAASLSVVQPSWYATAMALLVLLAAASYAAVLRGRGEEVPEAIRFTGAVRPADRHALAVRSVRPADLRRSARSVRP